MFDGTIYGRAWIYSADYNIVNIKCARGNLSAENCYWSGKGERGRERERKDESMQEEEEEGKGRIKENERWLIGNSKFTNVFPFQSWPLFRDAGISVRSISIDQLFRRGFEEVPTHHITHTHTHTHTHSESCSSFIGVGRGCIMPKSNRFKWNGYSSRYVAFLPIGILSRNKNKSCDDRDKATSVAFLFLEASKRRERRTSLPAASFHRWIPGRVSKESKYVRGKPEGGSPINASCV